MLQVDKIKTRVLVVSRSAPDPHHGAPMHTEDLIRYLEAIRLRRLHYSGPLRPPGRGRFPTPPPTPRHFPERSEYVPTENDAVVGPWEIRAVQQACHRARPALVIADYSWMGGIFAGPYFAEHPSVRKLIFAHDLRVRIMPSYVQMGLLKSEDNRWTAERESRLLSSADVLLTLNDQDKQMAQAMAPRARVLEQWGWR